MDTPEASTVSQSVISPVISVLQGYGLEDEFETKIVNILEKLGNELAVIQFVPSPDLVSLVEELLDDVVEEEWEEDDDDFDDGIELEEEDDDEGEEDVL